MTTPELLKALELMLSGKYRRLTPSGKDSIGSGHGQWWSILAIHCDGTLTLCSDTHSIFEHEPITSIKL